MRYIREEKVEEVEEGERGRGRTMKREKEKK